MSVHGVCTRALTVENVCQHELSVQAGLGCEELIALRLYTGPCYMLYNGELRRFLSKRFGQKGKKSGEDGQDSAAGGAEEEEAEEEMCAFCTTLHMISSAIIKLRHKH